MRILNPTISGSLIVSGSTNIIGTLSATTITEISAKKIKDKRDKKYAWDYFAIDFEPGLLILFPSYLHHSVPVNNTSKTRCSLAFNIVPSKSLGDESSLTELKF